MISAQFEGIKAEKKIAVVTSVDYIKINVKTSYTPYIWAYGSKNNTINYTIKGTWPGDAMTNDITNTGWYNYTISAAKLNGAVDAMIILSNNGSGQLPTATLTCGIWNLENGVWEKQITSEDIEEPIVSALPKSGRFEEFTKTITLTAKDNKDLNPKIYYTIDGTTPTILSSQYNSGITINKNTVIKAVAVDISGNKSRVYVFDYELGCDITPPVLTATPEAGSYETAQNVKLSVTDNKDSGLNIYYTVDGSEPKAELTYLYNGQTITTTSKGATTIRALSLDKSGNSVSKTFSYYIGTTKTTRFDPRQESIYFLLTTRWFDGNSSNSIGDEWCSWTEERANDSITDDGFTGPEDVTWRGDFKGLIEKMDYIKALGFTTIWITPIVQNRSPLAYHGYHGWDFTKEDARLLSPGYDFKRVIDEAHARDMKICLDIVINHSGRFGIKDFAEIKYNRDTVTYPIPDEWKGFAGYDEAKYQSGIEQNYPNGWQYDGLKSPGTIKGKIVPPWQSFTGDVRPFTAQDIKNYPNLTSTANGALKFQWPSTESYCLTIDGKNQGENNSLDYEGYKNSKRRLRGHNTGFPTG